MNTAARSTAGDWSNRKRESPPSPHLLFLKSSLGKGEGLITEETRIENTRLPTCLRTHRHAQLGEVKGEDALLVLVAVAPVTVKPVGGAMELWLGCRSLGMPLWELSWWPKAALN